jgi:putative ABC transport system ATP-binding protein
MTRAPAARLDAVHKIYPGAVPVRALTAVSLSIPRGAFAVVEGPSGSGKTTLLSLLGGLDRPSAGRVVACGTDLTDLSERALVAYRRRAVGFVFQDFKLIDVLTALENVALALRVRGHRRAEADSLALALLESLGLGSRARGRPDELSGGEKQRVAVARALVSEPPLILADEPTANLDGRAGEEVVDLLRSTARARGTTVVVVSHDPRVANRADILFRLCDGRLIQPADMGAVA